MARSRVSMFDSKAPVNSCAVWSASSALGKRWPIFGARTPAAGFARSSPRLTRNEKKLRMLDKWRATERGDKPLAWSRPANARTCSERTCAARASSPKEETKLRRSRS